MPLAGAAFDQALGGREAVSRVVADGIRAGKWKGARSGDSRAFLKRTGWRVRAEVRQSPSMGESWPPPHCASTDTGSCPVDGCRRLRIDACRPAIKRGKTGLDRSPGEWTRPHVGHESMRREPETDQRGRLVHAAIEGAVLHRRQGPHGH
jgi:hypothetical protein